MGVDLFSVGRSGLNVSKKMLETTSHNIANVNTEGYSRQRVIAGTNRPLPEGAYVLGTGAHVSDVRRSHDQVLEKRFLKSTTSNSYFQEREVQLGRVEDIFNEVNNEGLNKILNKFFNSFRELSNQPEDESVRNIVRENARMVIKDMKRVQETLNFIEDGINQNVQLAVEDINTLTKHIAKINIEILGLEAGGGETGDLRDQRDLAVKELSKYFKIQTYSNDKGQYTVNVENVGTLLAGGKVSELLAAPALPHGANNKERAPYEIFFKNRPSKPVTIPKNSGKIGAMLETRRVEIANLRKEVDTIGYNLAKSVNAIHRRGYKNIKFPEDTDGNPVYTPDLGKVSGVNFFKEPIGIKDAVKNLDLSRDVATDLNNISTGLTPNTPGDNRIAIAISKLQYEKVLGQGTTSFEEQYLKSVGTVGLKASKTRIEREQSDGMLAQATQLKEQNSGVSLDEEAANLVRFQHQYDANARVIKTSQETFDSLLRMLE